MDENTAIEQLEGLAERFGVQIRYDVIDLEDESIYVKGGLCELRGAPMIIINSRLTMKERIRTLAKALRNFDLDRVYMKPAIRELLNEVTWET